MILVSVAIQVCADASEYAHCSVSIDNKQTEALHLLSQCDYCENTVKQNDGKFMQKFLLIKIYFSRLKDI